MNLPEHKGLLIIICAISQKLQKIFALEMCYKNRVNKLRLIDNCNKKQSLLIRCNMELLAAEWLINSLRI
jgi:hypothetical protein